MIEAIKHSSEADILKADILAAIDERLKASGVANGQGKIFKWPDNSNPMPLLIGRVCDAEPLFETEATLARMMPERIIRGLGAAALRTKAQRIILAVDKKNQKGAEQLNHAARGSKIKIEYLSARYPLDDISLAYDIGEQQNTGTKNSAIFREWDNLVEHALILDATTLCNIAMALEGRYPLRRTITVAGDVREPAILQVPLGTSVQSLVQACGGSTSLGWVPFHNGVLGGHGVEQHHGVSFVTRGYIILPPHHPLVCRMTTPPDDQLRRISSACINCRICTETCPVHLNGGQFAPHRWLQLVRSSWADSNFYAQPNHLLLDARACLGCKLCNTVCPASLEPASVIRAVMTRLEQLPAIAQYELKPRTHQIVRDRLGRRTSKQRLEERLGLIPYVKQVKINRSTFIPHNISIPLKDLDGKMRVAAVHPDEPVSIGDVVALAAVDSDEPDYRSPIAGKVTDIDPDDGILITAS